MNKAPGDGEPNPRWFAKPKATQYHGYVFDVTQSDQVEGQVQAIERDVSSIDVLVNNAGI
jgi:NADP-dependent 3-hydroxy acid dehydrogenase YdfG